MLPVWPGWMPTPVADLLKRPLMTLILAFSGASGSSVLLSSISEPEPLADQCSGLTPQPMKSAANRFGHGAGPPETTGAAPPTGGHTSHGRARGAASPRRQRPPEGRRRTASATA